MRIRFIEVGIHGDEGNHWRWESDLDIADADEAYVKGREFQRLTSAMARGANDEWAEIRAKRDREKEEDEQA